MLVDVATEGVVETPSLVDEDEAVQLAAINPTATITASWRIPQNRTTETDSAREFTEDLDIGCQRYSTLL